MLFKSENIDSLLILVIPVRTARSMYGFVLNVLLKRFRVKDTSSCQKPFTYVPCIFPLSKYLDFQKPLPASGA